jgi:hypothetical protein
MVWRQSVEPAASSHGDLQNEVRENPGPQASQIRSYESEDPWKI